MNKGEGALLLDKKGVDRGMSYTLNSSSNVRQLETPKC